MPFNWILRFISSLSQIYEWTNKALGFTDSDYFTQIVFRYAPDTDPKVIERIYLKLARIYAYKLNQTESAGKQVNWPAE